MLRIAPTNVQKMHSLRTNESSSPGEFHPQALPEPDVNLSIHPARASPPPETFQSQAYLARKSSSQFPG